MDPPKYPPLSDKSIRKRSTTLNTNASAAAATPGIARPHSLAENHRPNNMPTSAPGSCHKEHGKVAADSEANPVHDRSSIINNSSQQQQQLPYNNMLLSGLNTSTILASESSSITPPAISTFFDTTTTSAAAASTSAIPPRPRRLWKVVDTKLPKFPLRSYPPPSPYTSCILTDIATTTPSVIAVRIAECLLRRNVCVEYDEETVTATVLTVDRCVMQIHLWRLSTTTTSTSSTSSTSSSTMAALAAAAAAGPAILIECVRTSGPVQTFHWTTQAVLQAAQGLDSGIDRRTTRRRRPYQASSALEYIRYTDDDSSSSNNDKKKNNDDDDDDDDEYSSMSKTLLSSPNSRHPDAMAAAALETLEYAYSLITKDRLGAQQLGMQWLVSLTDIHSVGIDAALYHALALLGGMQIMTMQSPPLASILYTLIVDKQAPNEQQQQQQQQQQQDEQAESSTGKTEPRRLRRRRIFGVGFSSMAASSSNEDNDDDDDNNNESVYPYQDHHASFLRSMALRVVVNALTLLSKHQRTVLESLLLNSSGSSSNSSISRGSPWTSHALIQALTDDLQGASRPPTAVLHSTGRLASCHEACLAIQCLGVLARHNVEAQRKILQNGATLSWLERARTVGRSTNMALYEQAESVYTFLTETERSC